MSVETNALQSSPASPPTVPPGTVTVDIDTARGGVRAFDDPDGPGFSDLLDLINPLQHIPIVGSVYREVTGDDRGAVSAVLGGVLLGGPIGLAAAIFELMCQDATGKGFAGNVVALFDGENNPSTQIAASAPAAETSAPVNPAPPAPVMAAIAPAGVSTQPIHGDKAESGPVRAGDYLIFGAASALSPARPQTTAQTEGAASASPLRLNAAIPSPGPMGSESALADRATEAAAPSVQIAAADSKPADRRIAATGNRKSWPVPERSGPEKPPQTLPPPTTGPGALPGGHSLALSATQVSQSGDAGNTQWFASAFNQAMDKYDRSARLGGKTDSAVVTSAGNGADSSSLH